MSIEDKIYKFLGIYKKLPTWMKEILAFPLKSISRKRLLGNNYSTFYKEALDFEYKSANDINEYQFLKLKQLLQFAQEKIPFYRDKWNEYGIKHSDVKSFDDFDKIIPFTTRSELQRNSEKFIPEKYNKADLIKANTGGSTGEPLALYYLKGYTRSAYNAYIDMLWGRFGYKKGMRYARLRGDDIGKNEFTYDPYRNCLILSSFHLNSESADRYLNLLAKYKIKYISAYPSSLYLMIKLSSYSSFTIPTLNTIMLGSENILDYQIKDIKSFFGAINISLSYGHGEFTTISGNCLKSMNYHFSPTYGYAEFCEPSIKIENIENNKIVEIVGTSFLNPAMPLIRYRSQDFGIPVDSVPCECGRVHKTSKTIMGREQEIAVGLNNERITITALVYGRHLNYMNNVQSMQIINYEPGKLHVKVVRSSAFTEKDKIEIIESFSEKKGMPFSAEVEYVESIPLSNRGKQRFLIRTF